MAPYPRFSVIIATYNRENYLPQAIESVLSQPLSNYEFIVVDDGSTDRTQQILLSYGSKIKTIRQENQGSEMAYKAGVSVARGEYIAFLDSDDFFFPNALATYDRIITELDSPPLLIGAMQRFEHDQDSTINSQNFNGDITVLKYQDYLSKNISIGLAQSRIVMKKTLFEKAQNGTGVPRERNLNDYRLILRAGGYGPCIIIKHPITLAYRYHETQSSKNIEKMCHGVLYLIDMVRHEQVAIGQRLFEKYAYLGGIVKEWSKKAYKHQLHGLAIKIIIMGWPMVIASFCRKIQLIFLSPPSPLTLANEGGKFIMEEGAK